VDCISKLDVVESNVEIGYLPTDEPYGFLIGNHVTRRYGTATCTDDTYAALAVRYQNPTVDVWARTRIIAIEKV
jgi:hypothetical protein